MKGIWTLVKATWAEFSRNNCFRLAASLSYYTIFSLSPMLVIVIGIAGLVLGEEAARGQLAQQLANLIGRESAEAVQSMIQGAWHPERSIWATAVGLLTLLVGATTVFVQLQDSMNEIWEAAPRESAGIWGFVRTRLLSFAMILAIGFLLLVSLVVNTALAAAFEYLAGVYPAAKAALHAAEILIALIVVTVLFGLIFKVLPDVEIAWRDVWIGGLATGALFTVGRTAIGLYLGNSDLGATYGSAAAVIVILLWVYYSSLILFLGAEFTQVWSRRHGRPIVSERELEKRGR